MSVSEDSFSSSGEEFECGFKIEKVPEDEIVMPESTESTESTESDDECVFIGEWYQIDEINEIDITFKNMIKCSGCLLEELKKVATIEDFEKFIEDNILIGLELTGRNVCCCPQFGQLTSQTIYVEDSDVFRGKKTIKIRGQNMDIANVFVYGT
jgi:hypothetical protein